MECGRGFPEPPLVSGAPLCVTLPACRRRYFVARHIFTCAKVGGGAGKALGPGPRRFASAPSMGRAVGEGGAGVGVGPAGGGLDLCVGGVRGGALQLPALPSVQAAMASAAHLQSTPRARKAKQAMYSQVWVVEYTGEEGRGWAAIALGWAVM